LCGALVKKIRNGHECVETGGSESAADFRAWFLGIWIIHGFFLEYASSLMIIFGQVHGGGFQFQNRLAS
jgi:hypothetical protein